MPAMSNRIGTTMTDDPQPQARPRDGAAVLPAPARSETPASERDRPAEPTGEPAWRELTRSIWP